MVFLYGGTNMLDFTKSNFIQILLMYTVFGLAYGSNIIFGLYNNLALAKEQFNPKKLLNSVIKAIVLILGTLMLISAITAISQLAIMYDLVSSDIGDFVTALSVITTILVASVNYVKEAYVTFQSIMNKKYESKELENKEDE